MTANHKSIPIVIFEGQDEAALRQYGASLLLIDAAKGRHRGVVVAGNSPGTIRDVSDGVVGQIGKFIDCSLIIAKRTIDFCGLGRTFLMHADDAKYRLCGLRASVAWWHLPRQNSLTLDERKELLNRLLAAIAFHNAPDPCLLITTTASDDPFIEYVKTLPNVYHEVKP